jgi:hypothetical protein
MASIIVSEINSFRFSKDRANELLRFGIEVLKDPHWSSMNKIFIIRDLCWVLEGNGYPWQYTRLLNHFHKFLHSLKGCDPLPFVKGGSGVSS